MCTIGTSKLQKNFKTKVHGFIFEYKADIVMVENDSRKLVNFKI